MPPLHHLQRIPLEIHLLVKIHLVERLHWNLRLAPIPTPIRLAVKLQIVLNGFSRIARFFIFARTHARGDGPEGHDDGEGCEEGDEQPCQEAATDLEGEVAGD